MWIYYSRKLRDEGRLAGSPSVDENVRCYVISAVDIFEGITRQQKRVNPPNLVRRVIISNIIYSRYKSYACPIIHGVRSLMSYTSALTAVAKRSMQCAQTITHAHNQKEDGVTIARPCRFAVLALHFLALRACLHRFIVGNAPLHERTGKPERSTWRAHSIIIIR